MNHFIAQFKGGKFEKEPIQAMVVKLWDNRIEDEEIERVTERLKRRKQQEMME